MHNFQSKEHVLCFFTSYRLDLVGEQVELSQILEIDEVGQVLANQFTLYMTWY